MKPKYRNSPTIVDDIRFASKKEARRYSDLKLLERAGEIRHLELQPRFNFMFANGKMLRAGRMGKPRAYVADFAYQEKDNKSHGRTIWRDVVEDVKGMRTELYKWKRDMMRDLNGIAVRET